MAMTLKRSEWAVLIFTVAYIVVFGAIFLAAGNGEFVWYVITLVLFLGLIAATQRIASPAFPPSSCGVFRSGAWRIWPAAACR